MYKRCACKNPATGKQYGRSCPLVARSDHGGWWFTHDVPTGQAGKRHRPAVGPFPTKEAADTALTASLAELNAGLRTETPAGLTVGQYLDDWLAGKVSLDPSTVKGYAAHIRLYLRPGLGYLRLTELRDHHVEQLYAAMRQIGRDLKGKRPSPLLTRLLEARKDDPARRRRLSPARIHSVATTLNNALNSAVKRRKIPYNPAEHVELEPARVPKPLAWTAPRVAAWVRTGRRPSKVMVWTPAQAGAFLDFVIDDRFYPVWHLVAHRALRRGEVVALGWAETDLTTATVYIRDNLPDPDELDDLDDDEWPDPKSVRGTRPISLDQQSLRVLNTWQTRQIEEQEQAGPAWIDNGRVFTHPDGHHLRPDGLSQRFGRLIDRFNKVRHEHATKGWSADHLATRHRMPVTVIEVALAFGPLPPIRFHDLRHTAASLTYLATRDLKLVSELLGHASVHFTGDTYTTLFEEVDRDAAEAVARLVPRQLLPSPIERTPETERPTSPEAEQPGASETERPGDHAVEPSSRPRVELPSLPDRQLPRPAGTEPADPQEGQPSGPHETPLGDDFGL
ncbi:site-specific integrase [Pseudofrankia sp. BMG5.36]|uniref:tyrosine-type recombinase/integrase n=1 Tax=Pseudofrankia sp. BMG5.36 TaxID=1834512 RepID=UPI001F51EADD|nr:site-specific integrase [Pseudofrankia sp. BMG5.36]